MTKRLESEYLPRKCVKLLRSGDSVQFTSQPNGYNRTIATLFGHCALLFPTERRMQCLPRRHRGTASAPVSPKTRFAPFLTRLATVDATVAGLASVHGCIGAVDPLRTFGTPEQQKRLLPKLASGEKLSGFALTEPCAGSDLTALRTTATPVGDHY